MAELLRATGLRKEMQGQVEEIMDLLNSGMSIDQLKAKGVLPPSEVDFSKVLDQFVPGIDTSAIDLESLGPGIVGGSMFDRLMGLSGTASGQAGVTSAAAMANQRSQVSAQQASQTISQLMYTLLNWKGKTTATPSAPNPSVAPTDNAVLDQFYGKNPYDPNWMVNPIGVRHGRDIP